MSFSGSKKTTKTTPWGPAEPYIKDSLSGLQSSYQTSSANAMASLPAIQAAMAKISGNIDNPPAYATEARDQLGRTIRGEYVNANPWTGDIADQIAKRTGAQFNTTFGANGRGHGGLAALLSGQGVGSALSSFYGDQFNHERELQQQAISMAPAFNADEYTAISPLLAAINASVQVPMLPATAYAGAVTNATAPYNTRVEKQSTPWGQILAGMAMQGIGALLPGAGAGAGLLGGGGGGLGLAGLLAGR